MYGNVVKLQGGNVEIHAPGYREKANRMPLLLLADAEAVVQTALAQPQVVRASRRINTGGMVSSREGYVRLSVTAPTVRIQAAMERLRRFSTSPAVPPGASKSGRSPQPKGGQPMPTPTGSTLCFLTADATSRKYSDVQIEDYQGVSHHRFPWRPLLRLSVRARFSHPVGDRTTLFLRFWYLTNRENGGKAIA